MSHAEALQVAGDTLAALPRGNDQQAVSAQQPLPEKMPTLRLSSGSSAL